MKVLLSIKPEFASEIFNGSKKYEYRRRIFKRDDIRTVLVYATSPVSQVVGEFDIDEILHDNVDSLWDETKEYAGISEAYFFTYFEQRETGYAIKIKSCNRYERPQSLASTYGMLPPQSFAYVED